jgi:hypothetical protein
MGLEWVRVWGDLADWRGIFGFVLADFDLTYVFNAWAVDPLKVLSPL